jgi:hypothetical protein
LLPKKGDIMAKKVVVILVLVMVVTGGVFAQAKGKSKTTNVKKNWISGEVSLLGAGA